MRWLCSRNIFLSAVGLVTLVGWITSGCNEPSYAREQRELLELETELNRILSRPREDWKDILDRIRKQTPNSQRVRDVRDFCVSAYETYDVALSSLEQAKGLVAELEAAIAEQNLLVAAQKKAEAETAMRETDIVLSDADVRVKACATRKNDLRARMAASN